MLLMARTPVLEHRVGPDVLARWHAVGGRLFLALVLVHAGAAVAAWAAARGQDLLTATVSVLGLPWLGAATAGTALFLGVVAVSVGRLRRRLSYELWHGLHLLTYVRIALSFVHELGGPNLAGQPVVQVLWTLLNAYALTLVLRFQMIAPLGEHVAPPAAGRRRRPRGGRSGERGHAGQARRRTGGAARAVLPLAVPHLDHLAQRAPVLAVRGAARRSAPDHRQGAGYGQRTRARRADGHPRATRGAVRGEDRPSDGHVPPSC